MNHLSYSPESAGKPSSSLPANDGSPSRTRPSSSYAVHLKAQSEHCYPVHDSEGGHHHSVKTPTRSTSLRHPRYEMAPLILDEFVTSTRRRLHADRLKPWTAKLSGEPMPITHSSQPSHLTERNEALKVLHPESRECSPSQRDLRDREVNNEKALMGKSASKHVCQIYETEYSQEQRKEEWKRIRAALQTEPDDERSNESPTSAQIQSAYQRQQRVHHQWKHSGNNFFPTGLKGLHQDEVVDIVLEERRRAPTPVD